MSAEPLTRRFIAEKNKLQQSSPMVWLYTVPLPTEVLRVCSYTEQITVDRLDDDGNEVSITYDPAPISNSGIGLSSDGRARSARVAVADVQRQLEPILEAHQGLVDLRITMEVINVNVLDQEGVKFHAYVTSQKTGEAGSSFNLSAHPGLRGSTLRRFNPRRCTHRYGGRLCGFDKLFPGAPQTCTRYLRGVGGCLAHRLFQQQTNQVVDLPGAHGAQIAVTGARR